MECLGHLKSCSLFSQLEAGGKHNERDWGRRLPAALRWLCGAVLQPPGEAFWTRPQPVRPGGPFELFVRKDRVALPERGRLQAYGWDGLLRWWNIDTEVCAIWSCLEPI